MVGSLTIVAKEIAKYKLYFVGAREVGWDRGGTETAGDYKIFCRNLASDIECRT
jgi:hypothetical protein